MLTFTLQTAQLRSFSSGFRPRAVLNVQTFSVMALFISKVAWCHGVIQRLVDDEKSNHV